MSMFLVHETNGSRTIAHHRELAERVFEELRGPSLGRCGWVHFEGRNIEAVAPMMEHLTGITFAGRISVEVEKVSSGH